MDTPLPRLTPRPRLLVCPPPQPGMIVKVVPPAHRSGDPPINSLIACVGGGGVVLITPAGFTPVPLEAWPPDQVVEVYSAVGEPLWRRNDVPVEGPPQ